MWLIPVAVGAIVLLQQLLLLQTWFRRSASEDWTLLWAAARAWGHLRPHEPFFWGQDYGTTFEAVPLEVLRWFGVGFGAGLPLVLLVGHLASWWLPATAAWRRGHRLLGTAAFGAPILLTTEYVVAASVYATLAGRVLASLAATLVILGPRRVSYVAAACGAAALGVLLDTSTALIAVPVTLFGLVSLGAEWHRRTARTVAYLALALLPAAAWLTLTRWWSSHHPEDRLSRAPDLSPVARVLGDHLSHPNQIFRRFAPELVRSGWLVIAVIVLVAARSLASRRPAVVWAAIGYVVVLLFAISLLRSESELPTPYYTAIRTVLPLPIGLWFLLVVGPPVPWSPRTSRIAVVSLAVVAGLTGVVRVTTWSSRGQHLQTQAENFRFYTLVPMEVIFDTCESVRQAADRTGANVAVFSEAFRAEAYACAAVLDGKVTTVYPSYERRSWVLNDLSRPAARNMLVVGPKPDRCRTGYESCRQITREIYEVALRGRSPVQASNDLGIPVRPLMPFAQ